ncbi:helix-turn-helix transcriptional regulator [Chitinophaga vietnamensis]|uniref:helix-turn-helix transcriptional regulator n=1 Tax=Chitinophaga vietnamensis TaxID=2593957 RepID=UPI0011783DC4|nr:AraC family transcriptional regulator [Chitinophaga vietnamensis]
MRREAPLEQRVLLTSHTGYAMQLEEVSCQDITFCWGHYTAAHAEILPLHAGKSAVVSHFMLSGTQESLREKQFVLYNQYAEDDELEIAATGAQPRTFFEWRMTEDFFEGLLTDESAFLKGCSGMQHVGDMLPEMYAIINDMHHAPYSGALKGLYLEAKATELFLAQLGQLNRRQRTTARLKPYDIECLHGIREYIDQHYLEPLTLSALARKAGINQTKLKSGFKAYFGDTLFAYIQRLRMHEARRLLLEKKHTVGEVSAIIGYQHPHHFTVAFKKAFNMLPSQII